MSFRSICALLSLIAALNVSAYAKPPAQPKPDLADRAAGRYAGAITSDARGSSQDDVNIVVAKVGPNRVKVDCDCSRIPARTFRLERAMNTIQNVGGDEVFLLDLSKSPNELNLTIGDAAWFGSREALR